MQIGHTKAEYQKWIWEYERRREELRKKYKINDPEYLAKSKVLQRKLDSWKQAVKLIEQRRNKIRALGNAVATFTGFNVRSCGGQKPLSEQAKLARALFYKYGLENRIMAYFLRGYTGDKDKGTPDSCRRRFTQSFSKDHQNKELWLRFKDHIERLKSTPEDGKY
jgi:hypothetical protein